MSEPAAAATIAEPFIESRTALADYEEWFAKPVWTLHQAAALMVGLNPDVTLNPETVAKYDNFDPSDPIQHELWRYSEQTWGEWREVQNDYTTWFWGSYCGADLHDIVESETLNLKPMDIIQWCVDENIPMHFRLTEYLSDTGYDFRFSKNSNILSQIQIYGRKDIWPMPAAAKLIVGLHPESTKTRLLGRKNLYRHLDANYSFTQRNEVYHVMELALESWKTKNLEFFEIYGDDPEEKYYDDEECGVSVEAKKFVNWAIGKGFKPPEQLLEFMGLKPAEQNISDQKPRRDDAPKDAATRKKEIIRDLIQQDKNFRFCGPSDDSDEQTSVTVGYQYLITQIKNMARPFLPEPIASSLAEINVEVNNIYSVYEAQSLLHALLPDIEDALENPRTSEGKVSENLKNPYWIEFVDASGEVVLNGLFTVAKPETNGQNYKIIKYLIANPNKFVTADDLKANALGGKNLDKRLTDFAAQINMNKDLGKLFFDTGNDSIRLNNPVTPERMTEQNIRRVRIKPA